MQSAKSAADSEEISLLIPLCNSMGRAGLLESNIARIARIEGVREVILADNGSTDGTLRLCESLAARHSCVSVIQVSKRGIAAVRDAGVAQASSRWVLFLDDDMEVRPESLTHLQRCLASVGERTAVVGGKVDLPENLALGNPLLRPHLPLQDFGQEERLLDPRSEQIVMGGGMVVRRSSWTECVTGRLMLPGRHGGIRFAGEDAEACLRLADNGFQIRYVPIPLILHHLSPERITESATLEGAYYHGVAWGFLRRILHPRTPLPLLVAVGFVMDFLRVMRAVLRSSRNAAFLRSLEVELLIANRFGRLRGNLIHAGSLRLGDDPRVGVPLNSRSGGRAAASPSAK